MLKVKSSVRLRRTPSAVAFVVIFGRNDLGSASVTWAISFASWSAATWVSALGSSLGSGAGLGAASVLALSAWRRMRRRMRRRLRPRACGERQD